MKYLKVWINSLVITFTSVKCMELPFASARIFPDSQKVFGFVVTLLYIIGKMESFRIFGYTICSAAREVNGGFYGLV